MSRSNAREIQALAGKARFKISEVSEILDAPIQTLHTWLKVGKIRRHERTSSTGTYLIPRSEVIRLLRIAGREVPGLWEKEKVRVLLIDDDPLIRKLGIEAAKSASFPMQLEAAATVEDGLLVAPVLGPEVVLLDATFPRNRLQGESALAFIRHTKLLRKVKVIAIIDHPAKTARMTKAGANGTLMKPFDLAEFRTAIYRQWKGSAKLTSSLKSPAWP